MNKTGIGFIGTGNVAELHEQAIRQIEDARFIGCVGKEAAETRRRAAQWSVRGYESYDALLDDAKVKAVFVLTPQESHVEHAVRALRKGKHVLVEKPVAPTPAAIRELERVARETGMICMPAHNYIYDPELRRAKRLVAQGHLGKVCALWINFVIFHPEQLVASWPGVLRQVGTHHFYTLLYLLGKPARLFASESRLHYEKIPQADQFMLQLEMPGGALASLFCSFATNDDTADPWTFHVKLLGTNGGVTYSWRRAVFKRALGTLPVALVPYEETFLAEDRFFLEECIAKRQPPLSTLEDAATTAELIEAAEKALQGHVPVEIP